MHVVQDYDGYGPWWLAEGIADYARYTLGVNNAGAGWSLPDYAPTQSYKDGYRVTARFLAWMEKHVKNGFVVQLDAALREHTYDGGFWTKVAGGTIDQLWTKYAKNPAI